jgi:hypothetical protein
MRSQDYQKHVAGKRHARTLKLNSIIKEAEEAFKDLERMNRWLVLFDEPKAESMTEARKMLRKVNVNLFDLLELGVNATPEEAKKIRHKSVAALAHYSYAKKKVFPLKRVKPGEELAKFLRELSKVWGFKRRHSFNLV